MKYTLNISFICSFVFSIIHLSLNNKLQIMKYCAQTWLRDPLLGSVLQQVFHYSALTLNVPMLETQSNQLYKQPAKHTPALPLQLQGHFCFYSSSQNAQIRPKYREKYKSIDSEIWKSKKAARKEERHWSSSVSTHGIWLQTTLTTHRQWRDKRQGLVTGHRCMLYDVSTQPFIELPRCTLLSQESR